MLPPLFLEVPSDEGVQSLRLAACIFHTGAHFFTGVVTGDRVVLLDDFREGEVQIETDMDVLYDSAARNKLKDKPSYLAVAMYTRSGANTLSPGLRFTPNWDAVPSGPLLEDLVANRGRFFMDVNLDHATAFRKDMLIYTAHRHVGHVSLEELQFDWPPVYETVGGRRRLPVKHDAGQLDENRDVDAAEVHMGTLEDQYSILRFFNNVRT